MRWAGGGWPEDAKEKRVLSLFAQLTDKLADFAEKHQSGPKGRRRPLAQPDQPYCEAMLSSRGGCTLGDGTQEVQAKAETSFYILRCLLLRAAF
jgi:hypothetical protein